MTNTKKQPSGNELYDLVLALAGSGTTIYEYMDLCEQLWDNEWHRIWLVAALMRKVSVFTEEPDEACIEFLAKKVSDVLRYPDPSARPIKNALVEFMPEIIQLMSEEVWQNPLDLWRRLLLAVADEYGLEDNKKQTYGHIATQIDATKLALLFVHAIGSKWTKELDEELEFWKDNPNYAWLTALRSAKKLDTLLETAYQQRKTTELLSEPRLIEKLDKMSPFERRRFMVLYDTISNTSIWADPVINHTSSTISWNFKIPLTQKAAVFIMIRGLPIGKLVLARKPEGDVAVEETEGIFTPMKSVQEEALTLSRAAASEHPQAISLTREMKSILQITRQKFLLNLEWCIPGD